MVGVSVGAWRGNEVMKELRTTYQIFTVTPLFHRLFLFHTKKVGEFQKEELFLHILKM